MLYDDLSEVQKDVFHAMNSLYNIGKLIVAKHRDMELFTTLRDWTVVFAQFVVRYDILTEDEMKEVIDFGIQEEAREKKEALNSLGDMLKDILGDTDEDNPLADLLRNIVANSDSVPEMPYDQELEDLFNAPAYGEDSEEDSES